MAQKLAHCDSASLNAEQFDTSLHWGVMKSTLFHWFAPLLPCGAKLDYAEFSQQKGRGNLANVSLGNSHALS